MNSDPCQPGSRQWLTLAQLVVFSLAACWWIAPAAHAQNATESTREPDKLSITDVEIGFGSSEAGHYKVGLWTPVVVTLTGNPSSPTTGVIEIESIDGDGFASIVQTANLTVPAGADARRQLLIRPGSQGGTIKVRFRATADGDQSGEIQAEKTADLAAMLSSQRLWVQVGADMRAADAMRSHDFGDDGAIEVATVTNLEELPTHWFGYEAVDILFVSVADPGMRDQLRGNSRIEALDQWVKSGGHLVLAVGAESAEASSFFAAGNDPHPLLKFLPGTFERMTEVSQAQELQQLTETAERFEIGDSYRLPVIAENPGSIVRKRMQNGAPLLVRAAYGFGQVTFTPVDWHRPPFTTWAARDRFINAVVGLPVTGVTLPAAENSGQLSHAGLTDMASQLRSGLDQFPNVSIVPFWAIALAIFGYIVLIGPVDYFLVKYGIRNRDGHARMELTWMTLPIWVILVSGIAYLMANRTKGDNLHVNQLIVEDHDLRTGTMRGSSWYSVFSPAMEAFDIGMKVEAGSESANRDLMTSWMGLPGRVLGGLAKDDTLLIGRADAYRYADGYARMQGTPVPVWSSRCFTARWMAEDQAPPLEVNITATSLGDPTPNSSIRNVSGYDLTNCMFIYHRWAYLIPELADGATVRLSSSNVVRRDLRDELNDRRLVEDEENNRTQFVFEPYDVLNRDVPAIVREMSVYEASGGKGYTQLENRYLSFMDLTPHIELQRGILIGFATDPPPLAQVQAAGSNYQPHEQTWKLLRFTFDIPILTGSQAP